MLTTKTFSRICAGSALFAALAGSLVSGATITPAPGTAGVSVSYSLSASQVDDYFVFHFVDANGVVHEGADSLGPIVPGITPNPAAFTLPFTVASGYGTVVGLYSLTGPSTGLVSIALNTSSASSAAGQSFGSVFSGTTEDSLSSDLITGGTVSQAALVAFLDSNSSLFASFNGVGTAVTATNMDFSNGASAGSFGVTILSGAASTTPEPSSFLLAAPGLLFVFRRKLMRS